MSSLTHVGQYWSRRHREVRLLGCSDPGIGPRGILEGPGRDLSDALQEDPARARIRDIAATCPWNEIQWCYRALPFPVTRALEAAEARAVPPRDWFASAYERASADASALDLAALSVEPDPDRDHLVAPVIPRRAQGFGVTYLNSALERETEGARGDYGYVYRAVKERGERPELFLKGTAAEHFVGPRGRMGLRRDLTNARRLDGGAEERVVVAAGIEPELAAVVLSSGEIWGYTLANDVSGNRIENETLLYLTQAKHFTGSLVLGPLVWLSGEQENPALDITARILDESDAVLFEHTTNTGRINAPLGRLIDWARSHVRLYPGEVFSTGTDCVPDGPVKVLSPGHQVEISAPEIGVLRHGAGVIPEVGDLNPDYARLEFEGRAGAAAVD